MKRLIALLLSALLACGAVTALAADYPIEEKFYRQMQESAFKGEITFEISGNTTTAMDAATWNLLKLLAPRLSITTDHSLYRGDGQATMKLMLDGNPVGETSLLYHDTLMALSSDLMAGKNVYYSAGRDWDFSALTQTVIQGDNAWPPLWRALMAVQGAPEEWKARAREFLIPYETKVGIWINGYAAYVAGTLDNVMYTELSCAIPAQAVKAEIKQLLVDFYADEELLSLLKEVFTAAESAAYLQSNMQNTFFVMLDALAMEGNVEIIRRYDAMGNAMLDQIVLPFAETQALSQLTISVYPEGGGQCWAAEAQLRNGENYRFTCVLMEDQIAVGSVEMMLLPKETEEENFVVSDDARKMRTEAFDYNLSWDWGEEIYTLATDKFERALNATLVIKPVAGVEMPVQSLTLEALFSSGSSQRSATRLDGKFTWRDLDHDAAITVTLSSKTAAPFAVDSLDQVTGAMRVDMLESDALSALINSWEAGMQEWIAQLTAQLIPVSAQ